MMMMVVMIILRIDFWGFACLLYMLWEYTGKALLHADCIDDLFFLLFYGGCDV